MRTTVIIAALLCAGLATYTFIFTGPPAEATPEMSNSEDNMTVTASGLRYEVITEGTGASPTATDTVEVHYEGTLMDGKKFDSSYDRGTTIEFPLNGVIPGWTEGVQLMKEGGKNRFVIPSDLAYGPRGIPGVIPGGATLVFIVELVKVK